MKTAFVINCIMYIDKYRNMKRKNNERELPPAYFFNTLFISFYKNKFEGQNLPPGFTTIAQICRYGRQ